MNDKLQVLERAFQVLEQIALDSSHPHTVGNLAQRTGLKIQTLSKIVRTMTVLGYLENTGRKSGYVLGEKMLRISEEYRDMDEMRKLVLPYLKEYSETIGEYICFSVLRGYHRRMVYKIRAKKANPKFRYAFPAEDNAFDSLSGICLVSRMPETRQLKFFERCGAPPFWGNITQEEYLQKMHELSTMEYYVSETWETGRVVITFPVICDDEVIGELGSFMQVAAYSSQVIENLRTIAGKIARIY